VKKVQSNLRGAVRTIADRGELKKKLNSFCGGNGFEGRRPNMLARWVPCKTPVVEKYRDIDQYFNRENVETVQQKMMGTGGYGQTTGNIRGKKDRE